MNDLNLASSTKRLLEAAKGDVPSSAARAKVWAGVSGVVGGAVAAGASGTASSAALAGSAGATKVLAVGGLFGGALTVGLAAVMLQIGAPPKPPGAVAADPPQVVVHTSKDVGLRAAVSHPEIPRAVDGPAAKTVESADEPIAQPAHTPASHVRHHAKSAAHEDSLAREASLVADARGALSVGDPQSALRSIRAARALPSKQLVPEELAVEEQALRALGRNDEANGINVMLRLQYPESALAP
jgi:hypothetical protein